MKRIVKFRGKQKSWIYGGVSIFNGEATIFDINCVANSAYEVDINSVGEFTGFLDKKENEIYEGDIIKYHHNSSKFLISYKALVVMDKGCFCLYWEREMFGKTEIHLEPLRNRDLRFMTVVGNNFDTPIELPEVSS